MNTYYNDMDLIDRFARGELDPEGEKSVRNRLATDEEFRILYDDMELMVEGINESAKKTTVEEKLKLLGIPLDDEDTDIEEIDISELDSQAKIRKIDWYKLPLVRGIAAAMAIVAISSILVGRYGNVSNDKLLADFFNPFENHYGNQRSEVNQEDIKNRAYSAYDLQDHAQAAILFEQLVESEPTNATDRFYLANTYLAMGEGVLAIENFKRVEKEGTGLVIHAKWYLALSYIQTGDNIKAKEALRIIADGNSKYSTQASKILRKIK